MWNPLKSTLNQLLKHAEPTTLNALLLKSIDFRITGSPNFSLYFSEHGPELGASTEAQLIIEGPLTAFLLFAFKRDRAQALKGGLTLTGDLEIAQNLQKLLESLSLENEALLAQLTGEYLSRPISQTYKQAKSLVSDTTTRISTQVEDYLKHETNLLPDEIDYEQFLKEVDALKLDVDRAFLRLQRLKTGSGGLNQ